MKLSQKNIQKIEALCKMHDVSRLYLFGSATTSKFSKESDIDLLVEFKPIDLKTYFDNYIDLKNKLKYVFNRDIDLLEIQTLKNPILISSIDTSKELIYG